MCRASRPNRIRNLKKPQRGIPRNLGNTPETQSLAVASGWDSRQLSASWTRPTGRVDVERRGTWRPGGKSGFADVRRLLDTRSLLSSPLLGFAHGCS